MDTFASEPDMRDRIVVGARLDGEEIGARACAQVSQATAFAQEAASRDGVDVLGAELGHVVR